MRTALQDGLINLCFQGLGVAGSRTERSQQCRSARQIAFGLCDSCLSRERIDVARCDAKKLVKLLQRIMETTTTDLGNRSLAYQVNIAGVEPLGFVEVGIALVPLAPPPCDISERLRDPAAIGQKLTRLIKVTPAVS